MTKICLVRHGESEWNKLKRLQGSTDIPLNDAGRDQAKQIGHFLKILEWDQIISSPLMRAKETADIIAKVINIPSFFVDKNLSERNYGKAEGMALDEVRKKYPDRSYEGAEEWGNLQKRVFSSILSHAKENPYQNIIFVSHGAAINSLLFTLSGGEFGSGITRLHNGCVNMLNFNGESFEIEYYNKKVYDD